MPETQTTARWACMAFSRATYIQMSPHARPATEILAVLPAGGIRHLGLVATPERR